jgi:hypothetical protein
MSPGQSSGVWCATGRWILIGMHTFILTTLLMIAAVFTVQTIWGAAALKNTPDWMGTAFFIYWCVGAACCVSYGLLLLVLCRQMRTSGQRVSTWRTWVLGSQLAWPVGGLRVYQRIADESMRPGRRVREGKG